VATGTMQGRVLEPMGTMTKTLPPPWRPMPQRAAGKKKTRCAVFYAVVEVWNADFVHGVRIWAMEGMCVSAV
jgi:hypothetical protein